MIYIKHSVTTKCPGEESVYFKFNYNKEIIECIKKTGCAIYDKKTTIWEVPISCLSQVLDDLVMIDDIQLESTFEEDETQNTSIKVDTSDFKTSPFSYQLEGIQYGLEHDKWLLLDAPGLGKTLQMIYLAQSLKKYKNLQHCFIVCGINTLKTNWKREIEKHSDLSCRILGERLTRKNTIVYDGVAERIKDINNGIEEFFIITNIETLRNDDVISALKKHPELIEMIVVDEMHVAKSNTSQQGKNLLKLNQSKYKVGLTGTVITNSPLDTYVPLKWIDVEKSNLSSFKNYYCNFGGQFNNMIINYKNISVLKDILEKHSLRRKKDLLDLPPKTVIHEFVDMENAQALLYTNVVNGIVSQIDKVKLSVQNVLSMWLRLRQVTACPQYLTTEPVVSSKVLRAVDLTQQIIGNGDKVVIFSVFKETLYDLQSRLKEFNPMLCSGDIPEEQIQQNIQTFQNDPSSKIMLATTSKMGTGITLTAASYMIFIDCPWTAASCLQCEDRIHRIGSKTPVFIYYLWTNNTIDTHVKDIVDDKSLIGEYIVDDNVPLQLTSRLESLLRQLTCQ